MVFRCRKTRGFENLSIGGAVRNSALSMIQRWILHQEMKLCWVIETENWYTKFPTNDFWKCNILSLWSCWRIVLKDSDSIDYFWPLLFLTKMIKIKFKKYFASLSEKKNVPNPKNCHFLVENSALRQVLIMVIDRIGKQISAHFGNMKHEIWDWQKVLLRIIAWQSETWPLIPNFNDPNLNKKFLSPNCELLEQSTMILIDEH